MVLKNLHNPRPCWPMMPYPLPSLLNFIMLQMETVIGYFNKVKVQVATEKVNAMILLRLRDSHGRSEGIATLASSNFGDISGALAKLCGEIAQL